MNDDQLKEIKERHELVTPDLYFFTSLGSEMVSSWPRGLWADDQAVSRDLRFHNAAHADVKVLIAEVESLQTQLDQAQSRSKTWRQLYHGKQKIAYQLIESIHQMALMIALVGGKPDFIGASEATYQKLLVGSETEDNMVATMEAIEDALTDPIFKQEKL